MHSAEQLALSDTLRPVAPPRIVDSPYTDEQFGRMVKVIRDHGPWDLILKHHFRSVEEVVATTSGGADIDLSKISMDAFLSPAFRGFFADNGVCLFDELHDVFYNAKFMEHARQYWGGAQYAMPYMMLFNLQAPANMSDRGHLDSPGFRGMWYLNTPTWLLSVMGKSGLFTPWLLKTAQVITWFYNSPEEGGFTYWPEGPLKTPARLASPLWNRGVVVQNEMMYHRGEPSGPKNLRQIPPGFTFDSTVGADPDSADGWVLRTGEQVLRKVSHQDMRYLFHWSAEVFSDRDDMKRRFDHLDDLTPERVFEMFVADLRKRKITFEVPSDPMTDRAFIMLLSRTYDVPPSSYPNEAPFLLPTAV
jgi:hypothetical protein